MVTTHQQRRLDDGGKLCATSAAVSRCTTAAATCRSAAAAATNRCATTAADIPRGGSVWCGNGEEKN